MKRYLVFRKNDEDRRVMLEEEVVFIGRQSINDISLADRAVSRQHAVIYLMGEATIIEDLRSHNGTFVNGKRIKRQSLSNGDIIRLGRVVLRFSQEEDPTD